MKVLLLNATYEPLKVVSMKRAVDLMLSDKAEVIHESEQEIGSRTIRFKMPTVIRLTYFVKVPYRARVPLNRRAVLVRDRHTCAYCNRSATTIDHVTPRSKGGPHTWTNLVACCRRCNGKKGNRTLRELGWELPFVPNVPTGAFWLVVNMRKIPNDWHVYLRLDEAA